MQNYLGLFAEAFVACFEAKFFVAILANLKILLICVNKKCYDDHELWLAELKLAKLSKQKYLQSKYKCAIDLNFELN
jgi:hypothetical protein